MYTGNLGDTFPPDGGGGATILATLHMKSYLYPCISPHYSLGAVHNKAYISPGSCIDMEKLKYALLSSALQPSLGTFSSAHP